MPPSPESPPLTCESCGRPAAVHHFPGASPTSGVWCGRHLARLRWLHPLGDRGRFLWSAILVAALVLLGAGRAAAQECRGVPAEFLSLSVRRTEVTTGSPLYTAEAALIWRGERGIYGNYATADAAGAGSSTRSIGARVFRQWRREALGVCVLSGYQLGHAYLVDVESTGLNFQETSTIIPVAAPISWTLRSSRRARITVFVSPQYLLQRSTGRLYDRGDTLSYSESPSTYATEAGASLKLGPVFVRAAWFKRSDREGDITLGGGLAW